MARIRSIHPDLATDDAFVEMSLGAKAAWPLLWTICDDHGVFEWKPKQIKLRLLPADDIDMSAILSEWLALGSVTRFDEDGRAYGAVRNFMRFQSPRKPTYRFPFPEPVRPFVGFAPKECGTSAEPVQRQDDTGAEAVQDQCGTSAVPLQHGGGIGTGKGEGEGEGEERKTLRALAPDGAPDGASDVRTRLFREGLAALGRMTGTPEARLRPFLGKLLKDANDDALRVLRSIEDAERDRVADPRAWIPKAIRSRSGRTAQRDGPSGFVAGKHYDPRYFRPATRAQVAELPKPDDPTSWEFASWFGCQQGDAPETPPGTDIAVRA